MTFTTEFENILPKIAGKHYYYIKLTLMFSLISISLSGNLYFMTTFLSSPTKFVCVDEFAVKNPNISWNSPEQQCSASYPSAQDSARNLTYNCQKWEYPDALFNGTIAIQFSLHCESNYLLKAFQSGYFLFDAIGKLCGMFSDIFGRRRVIIGSLLYMMIMNIVHTILGLLNVGMLPVIIVFLAINLGDSALAQAYCMMVEITPKRYRFFYSNLVFSGWSVSFLLLTGVVYANGDWRMIRLTLTILHFLYIPLFLSLLESPRWLLTRNKLELTNKTLHEIARRNGGDTFGGINVEKPLINSSEMPEIDSIWRLFTNPLLFSQSFFIVILMCIVQTCYGNFLIFSNILLNVNFYWNGIIQFFLELFVLIISMFCGHYGNRRLISTSCFLLSFIALFARIFTEKILPTHYITVFAMIARVGIGNAFAMVYIIASETFPTSIRQRCMFFTIVIAVGSAMSAPYIPPMIVFGMIVVATIINSLLIAETKNRTLPQTIDDFYVLFGKRPRGVFATVFRNQNSVLLSLILGYAEEQEVSDFNKNIQVDEKTDANEELELTGRYN